ncbi:MAG: N-acetyltransferase [Deltaproteobacteria bacterium]|nr:MAG: N-acetyltransferase [Deltaproteobacteria bacterium]
MSDANVRHNPSENRFEVQKDGHLAVLDYRMEDSNIRFIHTGVPEELGGQGIGKQLAVAGLTYAKENQLGVIPQCPFVRGYIERHPEWQEYVVSDGKKA